MAWQRQKLFCSLLLVAVLHLICLHGNQAVPVTMGGSNDDVCSVDDNNRFDCYPQLGANKDKCEALGCCWRAAFNSPQQSVNDTHDQLGRNSRLMGVPYCFYGKGQIGYSVTGKEDTPLGFRLHLSMKGHGSPFGGDIKNIAAEFFMETNNRLRVKIYDPANQRYEVPIPVDHGPGKADQPQYKISYQSESFGFAVQRAMNNIETTIFNSSVGAFIFSDQFLQISSLLSSKNLYGLGEHVLGLNLFDKPWQTLTMFSRDVATPAGGCNLYGVHPFYLNLDAFGQANGVLLLNSNAMDIALQPTPAITYKTIGGILDFYFFMGPDPESVVQQYTELIGKPTMPPYWALGFQLCRYGYNSLDNMKMVRKRMQENQIPQDVQWNDIDYMQDHLDFTYDINKFKGLPEFVDELHGKGMHYVLMADPAIGSAHQGYEPYDDGVQKDIFIKNQDGSILQGVVWPGKTAFPDFFHPNISEYWYTHINNFHKVIDYDGLWIDMNEPSNFVKGSEKGCPKSTYENPPYVPGIIGGLLADQTVCMTSTQVVNGKKEIHYNTHSLYGYSESVVTMQAMRKVLGKRSLVISRSTYPNSGVHSGHWLGDNHASWDDLYYSVAGILNFNLFGIPLVGADICGFIGDTNEELCSRWMQLGAFYPFSRNHNNIGGHDQDPAAFGQQLIKASRTALNTRYSLLPYLYSLFYNAHANGTAVARPLFYEFPEDHNTYGNDKQFMWGHSLLISPVLTQGALSVDAYFPLGTWYDFYTGEMFESKGVPRTLFASFTQVNLHVREGAVLPMQRPGLTTTFTRKQPFSLLIALDFQGRARGHQYIDDGESFLESLGDKYLKCDYTVAQAQFTSSCHGTFIPENNVIEKVTIYGVKKEVTKVSVNGQSPQFKYDSKIKRLTISGPALASISKNNVITWA